MRRITLLCAASVALTWSSAAQAQKHDASGASHETAGIHEEETEHLNTVGLFGGGTVKRGEPGEATLALEYTRRFRHGEKIWPVWLGAVGEVVLADEKEYLLILVAYWRPPHSQAWLRTGPGVEWTTEESHEAGHGESTETTTEFVYRLGGGYTMELGGGIGLAPSLDLDFVRSTVAVVFGFTLEYGF